MTLYSAKVVCDDRSVRNIKLLDSIFKNKHKEFIKNINIKRKWSWDSSVGIMTGCGLDDWGSISGRGKRFFCTAQYPDQLLRPPSLLSNGTRGSFPRGKAAGS
jgi:hypothetical protein